MGVYYRKSIKFGGFRVNLSKSGIGYSYGVKGFRISAGPRGTYATVGAGGFYYRERIDKPKQRPPQPHLNRRDSSPHDGIIETADVNELIDASSERVLSEVNERRAKIRLTLLIVPLSFGIVLTLFVAEAFLPGCIALLCAVIATWTLYRVDQQRRTTELFYELEGETARRFSMLQRECQNLSTAQLAWRVESNQTTWDWKRNAGASSLITRRRIAVGRLAPPCIQTNIDPWGIDTGNLKLYFFPDRLFVEQQGRYGAVSYDSLGMECSPSRFIEDGLVPKDAQIVDYTWKYVRRDGGPDRRFSNNRQLPVALYGHLEISSANGLNIHLQISNLAIAQEFSQPFHRTEQRESRKQRQYHQTSRKGSGARPVPPADRTSRSPYDVLGVGESAAPEEISAAYKRLAQLYHPDKVATLAPEFRELAEHKMKEINAAYQILKRN